MTALALVAMLPTWLYAQPPDLAVRYRLSFPQREHHWMQVEAIFTGLGAEPLELRMSRSSPGRYALHDFAKNVYDVNIFDADGRELLATRPDAHGWTVASHGGSATVRYKVFGDRVDGTYLGIDETHAHMNMPAVIMWARGLEDRPASVVFEQPPGTTWQIATQLYPGAAPLEFRAPNLQYLMDSPVEFGPLTAHEFVAGSSRIRVAIHHEGEAGDARAFVADVEQIVNEQREIFGEYPAFEPGYYTVIADYLPQANGDGMEHRNSTIVTSPGTVRANRSNLLGTIAHEFFHAWNIERIRPRSLEPFNFERENMSAELWLGEGFTQYYGVLTMGRAGLLSAEQVINRFSGFLAEVISNPARTVRSAEEMSELAPFTDGAQPGDATNWAGTYISYYTQGAAIALAMDLSLRARGDGKVSLDDYMRALWRVHGAPGGSRPGYVDKPYTMADAEARLAEVSGDPGFAQEFFARYIKGRELPDYEALLRHAGLTLKPVRPGAAWLGDVQFDERIGRVVIGGVVPFGSPVYEAGLDVGDEIRQVDGTVVRSTGDLMQALSRRRPGDRMMMTVVGRSGDARTHTIVLEADPQLDVVMLEAAGESQSMAQQTFRDRWLR